MKYIFLILSTRDGEREYSHLSVHQIRRATDSDKWAARYCSDFWGKADEKDVDNVYWFDGWSICTWVDRVQVISKQEYEILKQYL